MRWIVVILMLLFVYAQTGGLYSDMETWQTRYDYYQSDAFQKEQQAAGDAKMSPDDVKTMLTLSYFTQGFPGDRFTDDFAYFVWSGFGIFL
ncbi:hypothetical protein HCJ66_10730 [Listeria sp. FSL L7-1582]|uniref:hypothetical protein n=1 Tax=Listeria portnoyi TaxID=2713504 RepID=UPI00164EA7ED|nr:hypothetical protein [Listeria portnoyi]MBC6310015.1 hypothetical protein [Listeria portnoyi]